VYSKPHFCLERPTNLSYQFTHIKFAATKVLFFFEKNRFFTNNHQASKKNDFLTIRECIDFQLLAEKLQKRLKKNLKKKNVITKKCIPLHRFNKQMIVLQIKKLRKNEEIGIYVRSCCSYFFRILW